VNGEMYSVVFIHTDLLLWDLCCAGPPFVGFRSNRITYRFVFVVELITALHSA
jgi:predicted membrane protein